MGPGLPPARPAGKLLLYGSPTCGMVPPVRSLLRRARVPFDYVDISFNPAAGERVRAINGGNESLPTLVFPDGGTLTEPSDAELGARLVALGYRLTPPTWQQTVLTCLENPILRLMGLILLASGLLGTGWNMVLAGAVLLAASLLAGRLNR